jgi:hypothetical protein
MPLEVREGLLYARGVPARTHVTQSRRDAAASMAALPLLMGSADPLRASLGALPLIGRLAAELLARLHSPASTGGNVIRVPALLIMRRSCGCAHNRPEGGGEPRGSPSYSILPT